MADLDAIHRGELGDHRPWRRVELGRAGGELERGAGSSWGAGDVLGDQLGSVCAR